MESSSRLPRWVSLLDTNDLKAGTRHTVDKVGPLDFNRLHSGSEADAKQGKEKLGPSSARPDMRKERHDRPYQGRRKHVAHARPRRDQMSVVIETSMSETVDEGVC